MLSDRLHFSSCLATFVLLGLLAGCGADATSSGEPASGDQKSAAENRGDGIATTIGGLVAYLSFDGNLEDQSEKANHGVSESVVLGPDRFGLTDGVFVLDGVSDHVALSRPALPRQPTAFTISLWVQTRATELSTLVFAGEINDGAMWLRLSPLSKKLVALSQGIFKLEIPDTITDGAWHHIVMRLDTGTISLWVDGVMEGESGLTGALELGDDAMVFGRLGEPNGTVAKDHLKGSLDDVSVFDVALKSNEITTLFKEGPARPPSANAGDDQLVYFGPARLDGTQSSDPDGTVVEYVWDFGDGTPVKMGDVVEHAFTQPGIYEVTLTVIDDEGNSSTDTVLVEVVVMEDDWALEWTQHEIDMLNEVNIERAKGANCGGDIFGPAPPIELDTVIRIAARLHSLDMGTQNYFEHEALDGRSPFDRMDDVGFNGPTPWGENIAAGSPTAAGAMNGLMNSPGHCRNIMNPSYRVAGFGFAYVAGSEFGEYWTQNFAGGHGDNPTK
ncbi:MAG: hypothetical protein ACI9OJ_004411 [Myxococcota bacterium]|jgi:hypothetical protein